MDRASYKELIFWDTTFVGPKANSVSYFLIEA